MSLSRRDLSKNFIRHLYGACFVREEEVNSMREPQVIEQLKRLSSLALDSSDSSNSEDDPFVKTDEDVDHSGSTCSQEEDKFIASYRQRVTEFQPQRVTQDFLTTEEESQEVITIRYTRQPGMVLTMMVENCVFSVRFIDSGTGELFDFNLAKLSEATLPYGTEFSKNKFAKVTWRFLNGPSLLFFGSGAAVLTGAPNPEISCKALDYSVARLREFPLYSQLAIGKNVLENIVAKGMLPFRVCLHVLKSRFPNAVQYTKKKFTGAVIRVSNIMMQRERSRSDRTGSRYSNHSDSDSSDSYDYAEEEKERQKKERVYASRKCEITKNQAPVKTQRVEEEEDDADEEEDEETEQDEEQRAEKIIRDAVLRVCNPENLDQHELRTLLRSKKNVTLIVFDTGLKICAGSKLLNEMRKSCSYVLVEMLIPCRETEENMLLEKELSKHTEQSHSETMPAFNRLLERLIY